MSPKYRVLGGEWGEGHQPGDVVEADDMSMEVRCGLGEVERLDGENPLLDKKLDNEVDDLKETQKLVAQQKKDLEALTVVELKKMAEDMKLGDVTLLKKKELVDVILKGEPLVVEEVVEEATEEVIEEVAEEVVEEVAEEVK